MILPDFVAEGFDDMVEEEKAMPIHGLRMLTFMDDEGNTWLKIVTAGEPHLNDVVAMMERGKFLMQMKDFMDDFNAQANEATGDDDQSV